MARGPSRFELLDRARIRTLPDTLENISKLPSDSAPPLFAILSEPRRARKHTREIAAE